MKIMTVNDRTTYTELSSLPNRVLVISTASNGLVVSPDFPNITTGGEYLIYKDIIGAYGLQVLFSSYGHICIRRFNIGQWESWKILAIQ